MARHPPMPTAEKLILKGLLQAAFSAPRHRNQWQDKIVTVEALQCDRFLPISDGFDRNCLDQAKNSHRTPSVISSTLRRTAAVSRWVGSRRGRMLPRLASNCASSCVLDQRFR